MNLQAASLTQDLKYSKDQVELSDFVSWISEFVKSDKFYRIANEFIDIEQKLKTEPVGQVRSLLVDRQYSMLDDYE